MDSVKLEKKLKSWIDQHPEIIFASIFGSYADERFTKKSGVDVAIMCSTILSIDERVNYALELNTLLSKEVDLVDLSQAHGLILKEVLTTSKILINTNMDLYTKLIKRYLFEEADYGPLRKHALEERRNRVFKADT